MIYSECNKRDLSVKI